MKKILSLTLSALLCASLLGGCGEKTTESAASVAAATDNGNNGTDAATATGASVNAGGAVDATWFNDAVFVGDSITTTLDFLCADDPNLLGDAQFVCADCLSYHNAMWDLDDEDAVHPTYHGEKVLAETAAEITGASKMFILLGVNDVDGYGVEDSVDALKEFIPRVLAHSPGVELYFQSTTPMITAKETDVFNNAMIREFDAQVEAYCKENGYHYLDLYHQMCDETGALRDDYCVDPDDDGIHFTDAACGIWVNFLKSAVTGGTVSAPADNTTQTQPGSTPAAAGDGQLAKIFSDIKEQVPLESGTELTEIRLMKRYYGITEELAAEFAGIVSDKEEIVLVKAVDENAAASVKEKLETRYTSKLNQNRNYNAELAAMLEKCSVEQDGVYVSMILSENAEQISDIFRTEAGLQ